MRASVAVGKKLLARVHGLAEGEQPALLTGPITWDLVIADGGSGITMEVSADTMTATFSGVTPGTLATLTVSSTTENGQTIAEEHELIVAQPTATHLSVTFEEAA